MIMTICMLKDYGKYKNGMKYTISANVALRLIEDGVAFSCCAEPPLTLSP